MVIRLSSMNWQFWPRLRIALTCGYKHLEDFWQCVILAKTLVVQTWWPLISQAWAFEAWFTEHGINSFLWSRSQIQLESNWPSPEQSCHSGWCCCTQCLLWGRIAHCLFLRYYLHSIFQVYESYPAKRTFQPVSSQISLCTTTKVLCPQQQGLLIQFSWAQVDCFWSKMK